MITFAPPLPLQLLLVFSGLALHVLQLLWQRWSRFWGCWRRTIPFAQARPQDAAQASIVLILTTPLKWLYIAREVTCQETTWEYITEKEYTGSSTYYKAIPESQRTHRYQDGQGQWHESTDTQHRYVPREVNHYQDVLRYVPKTRKWQEWRGVSTEPCPYLFAPHPLAYYNEQGLCLHPGQLLSALTYTDYDATDFRNGERKTTVQDPGDDDHYPQVPPQRDSNNTYRYRRYFLPAGTALYLALEPQEEGRWGSATISGIAPSPLRLADDVHSQTIWILLAILAVILFAALITAGDLYRFYLKPEDLEPPELVESPTKPILR